MCEAFCFSILCCITCTFHYLIMIDFQLYSGREQVKWYIKKNLYRNEGSDRSAGSTHFDCHWKNMKSWEGTKNLVFCSSYNEPTLFLNLKKEVFIVHYPLWSMVRLSVFWPVNAPSGVFTLSATQGRNEKLFVWALGTFTSAQLYLIIYFTWNNN